MLESSALTKKWLWRVFIQNILSVLSCVQRDTEIAASRKELQSFKTEVDQSRSVLDERDRLHSEEMQRQKQLVTETEQQMKALLLEMKKQKQAAVQFARSFMS